MFCFYFWQDSVILVLFKYCYSIYNKRFDLAFIF